MLEAEHRDTVAESSSSGWAWIQVGSGVGVAREGDGGILEARRVRDEGLNWAECPELWVPGPQRMGTRAC